MESLQANPECQLLNATSVLAAFNFHIVSVVSLLNIVRLVCLSLYREITPGFAHAALSKWNIFTRRNKWHGFTIQTKLLWTF